MYDAVIDRNGTVSVKEEDTPAKDKMTTTKNKATTARGKATAKPKASQPKGERARLKSVTRPFVRFIGPITVSDYTFQEVALHKVKLQENAAVLSKSALDLTKMTKERDEALKAWTFISHSYRNPLICGSG